MAGNGWTVRTGRHGERDDWALSTGRTGGGWSEIPDLTPMQTREEIADLVRSVYGTERPRVVPNYTG